MVSTNKLAVTALVALAALVTYWMYGNYQKRVQQNTIAALVSDGSAQLKAALAGEPSAASITRIDAALQALRDARASRQTAMASPAEGYLVSARAIVLRRADVARAAPQVAASRQALA